MKKWTFRMNQRKIREEKETGVYAPVTVKLLPTLNKPPSLAPPLPDGALLPGIAGGTGAVPLLTGGGIAVSFTPLPFGTRRG